MQTKPLLSFGIFANGLVEMANGDRRYIQSLKKGDRVFCPLTKEVATIVCVVESLATDGLSVGGSPRTVPFQPVWREQKWHFAKDVLGKQRNDFKERVIYNLILSSGHHIWVNGVCCLTLGYQRLPGKLDDSDDYCASSILSDLRQLPGWETGQVKLFQ